jgi:hypothetical protein
MVIETNRQTSLVCSETYENRELHSKKMDKFINDDCSSESIFVIYNNSYIFLGKLLLWLTVLSVCLICRITTRCPALSVPYFQPHVLGHRRVNSILSGCVVSTLRTLVQCMRAGRGELSYLAPLGSEKISALYFKQCFFRGGITPRLSQTPRLPLPRQK